MLLVLHAVANGWVGPWVGHNFYNAPDTAWIGTYPLDPMHFLAGFTIAAIVFNFELGDRKRHYMLIPVLATVLIAQNIGLIWELAELVAFGRNPSGFIQVRLLDTLWDQLMDVLGAVVAVLGGEHLV
jgi:hypothetical protein